MVSCDLGMDCQVVCPCCRLNLDSGTRTVLPFMSCSWLATVSCACACASLVLSLICYWSESLIVPKDGKLTCGFFGKVVALTGSRLPIDAPSGTLPSLLDFGVLMPKRLPASTIQLPFLVLEPADAGVVGRD